MRWRRWSAECCCRVHIEREIDERIQRRPRELQMEPKQSLIGLPAKKRYWMKITPIGTKTRLRCSHRGCLGFFDSREAYLQHQRMHRKLRTCSSSACS